MAGFAQHHGVGDLILPSLTQRDDVIYVPLGGFLELFMGDTAYTTNEPDVIPPNGSVVVVPVATFSLVLRLRLPCLKPVVWTRIPPIMHVILWHALMDAFFSALLALHSFLLRSAYL